MTSEPDLQSAAMIAANADHGGGALLLRKAFTLSQPVSQVVEARLQASALGVFEAHLNGRAVSEDVLSPGWSSYEWRVRYRTYDVSQLLADESVIGFVLGNGWARGRLAFAGRSHFYTDELGVIATLHITYADGTVQVINSDDSWQSARASTTHNDLYDGQTIDARIPTAGWATKSSSPAIVWSGVHPLAFDHARLTPYIGPPVIRHEELAPEKVWQSPSGRTLVDFGQNLVGWVRLAHRGRTGDQIVVRHAEVLENEELGTRPLRSARATDTFICSGGDDVFEPTMTFHGFRYVEVNGPADLDASTIRAVVVHSDLQRIGRFECSDPLLNQLHSNVVWSQRGNFLDLPTDCPQRDERLGWTGDIAAFASTAVFLYDVEAFMRDWLADLAVEQAHGNGVIPFVVPDILKIDEPRPDRPHQSTCLWSDAGCWVPWVLWCAYGNEQVLAEALPVMTAHLRHVRTLLSPQGLWDEGFQFGDWLDPTAPPDDPFKAKADVGVVATACLYRSADIAARTAEILGDQALLDEFRGFADSLRAAFNEHYVDDGRVLSDCPTVYALAITFGLLEEDDLRRAGARLAELVRLNGFHVATGFAGTPFVCDALVLAGHLDEAYALLTEKTCPSWLYPVTMGGTTIWERWDSMLPDGSINPGQMTSFNHYAFGAIADFMHRVVGGLAAAEPGYRRVLIAPRPGGGITWARTSLESPHGRLAVRWHLADDRLAVAIDLPGGVEGILQAPDGSMTPVTGKQEFDIGLTHTTRK